MIDIIVTAIVSVVIGYVIGVNIGFQAWKTELRKRFGGAK
jgi:hypothetical protein